MTSLHFKVSALSDFALDGNTWVSPVAGCWQQGWQEGSVNPGHSSILEHVLIMPLERIVLWTGGSSSVLSWRLGRAPGTLKESLMKCLWLIDSERSFENVLCVEGNLPLSAEMRELSYGKEALLLHKM